MLFIPSHTRFMKNMSKHTYEKRYIIDNHIYRVSIPFTDWNRTITKKIVRWLQSHSKCMTSPFPYGTITRETSVTPDMVIHHTCEKCGKILNTLKTKTIHMESCNSKQGTLITTDNEPTNPRTTSTDTTITTQNNIETQNNVYVQNNIEIRDFGKENPKWLTTTLLHKMMDNIYRAIPTMMEKKHFNDEFPENKNLSLSTSKDVNKRMRVFSEGRWHLKNSKQTFYKVLVDIYEIMSDALAEDIDEDDEDVSDEIKEFQRSQRFMFKMRQIRPVWKTFQDKIEGYDKELLDEYWEDLKTLLLDKQLGIEQGFDD